MVVAPVSGFLCFHSIGFPSEWGGLTSLNKRVAVLEQQYQKLVKLV